MKKAIILLGITIMAFLFTFDITACKSPEDNKPSPPNTPEPIQTTPLNPNASGVQTFTSNTSGNANLNGSPYGYEMWTEGGNNNKLIWYGPNQGGGAAFRAEWNSPNDFLGRVGFYWGNGGLFTQYFSIRQTLRKKGTISITEHFKKWDAMNMKLGNMYEAKFLVEAGGGTGWLELTWLRLTQEDTPR